MLQPSARVQVSRNVDIQFPVTLPSLFWFDR